MIKQPKPEQNVKTRGARPARSRPRTIAYLSIGLGAAILTVFGVSSLAPAPAVTKLSAQPKPHLSANPTPSLSGLPQGPPPANIHTAPPTGYHGNTDPFTFDPPGPARVRYPDGTTITWPAAPSGKPWVVASAATAPPTPGGAELQGSAIGLIPGATAIPGYDALEEGTPHGAIGGYAVSLVDGGARLGAQNKIIDGRFVVLRVSRGGLSAMGADYDKCGTWPGKANNLGMEGLTPKAAQTHTLKPAGTLTCALATAHDSALRIVHAERKISRNPAKPAEPWGTLREAFAIRGDGTAVNITSSVLTTAARLNAAPRPWAFLDNLLTTIGYPSVA